MSYHQRVLTDRRNLFFPLPPFPSQVSPQEQSALVQGFTSPDTLQASGIHVDGKKYFTLQANERSIYGKQGVSISSSLSHSLFGLFSFEEGGEYSEKTHWRKQGGGRSSCHEPKTCLSRCALSFSPEG